MQGFFRILPTRSDENLPPSWRLRVFHFVVLYSILNSIAGIQHIFVDWFQTNAQKYGSFVDSWHFSAQALNIDAILISGVMLVSIELIEIIQARQVKLLPNGALPSFPEEREWSLPYVLFIAILAGLWLLEWIGIGMMIDWKAIPGGLSSAISLFSCVYCVSEIRALMNRQRACAVAMIQIDRERFPLTIWLLALPFLFYWVVCFNDNILNEMAGCAIVGIIATSSYLPHGEGIHLFVTCNQWSFELTRWFVYLPVLWSVLMIYKAGRHGIGRELSTCSPLRRRLTLGVALALAFIWPSLPRWIFPKLARSPVYVPFKWTRFLLPVIAGVLMSVCRLGFENASGIRVISFYYNHLPFHHSLWMCGALYELTRLLAAYPVWYAPTRREVSASES